MPSLAVNDPSQLARLEDFLINMVGPHFRETGNISAEDFLLILIWKANRSKNMTRARLEARSGENWAATVATIAQQIYEAVDDEARLNVLIRDWGFRLATASAVLTVLYPDRFTVYDIRVCNTLGNYHNLASRRNVWTDYQNFIEEVRNTAPPGLSLREKDHYLWGSSLLADIQIAVGGVDEQSRS